MCHSFLNNSLLGTYLSCVCVCACVHVLVYIASDRVAICVFVCLSTAFRNPLSAALGVLWGGGRQPSFFPFVKHCSGSHEELGLVQLCQEPTDCVILGKSLPLSGS